MNCGRMSRPSRNRAWIFLSAVFVLGGSAWGQYLKEFTPSSRYKTDPYGGNTAIEFLKSFDADKDGQVNRAEFLKAYETMFEIMDASGDGKLDSREVLQDPARMYGERARWSSGVIARYDADENGTLSAEEAPFWSATFARADANKDAQVDCGELTTFAFELELLRGGLQAENPAKVAGVFLKRYDKNADGKIAREEFEWDDQTFARYDRDQNRILDQAELARIPPLPPSPKARARDVLKQRDKDGNGQLSAMEYGEAPDRFNAADTNADGQLSLDEIAPLYDPYAMKKRVSTGRSSSKRLIEEPKAREATKKPIKPVVKFPAPNVQRVAPKPNKTGTTAGK